MLGPCAFYWNCPSNWYVFVFLLCDCVHFTGIVLVIGMYLSFFAVYVSDCVHFTGTVLVIGMYLSFLLCVSECLHTLHTPKLEDVRHFAKECQVFYSSACSV